MYKMLKLAQLLGQRGVFLTCSIAAGASSPAGMFHVKQPPQPALKGGEEHQNENGGS